MRHRPYARSAEDDAHIAQALTAPEERPKPPRLNIDAVIAQATPSLRPVTTPPKRRKDFDEA